MRARKCIGVFAALFLLTGGLWAGRQFQAGPGEQTVPDQLIIRLNAGGSIANVLKAIAPSATYSAIHQGSNLFTLQLPPGLATALAAVLAAHPQVAYVEPNRVRHTSESVPNDLYYSSQWDFAAINALQAWNTISAQYLTASSAAALQRIKVAVLDTGIDCGHPDFINAGGSSPNTTAGGQIDIADSRAFVASTISSSVCPVMDDNGHGTHVAGTIAAATQNGSGVAGVAWPVTVVSYKVLDRTGSGSDSTIAQAIMAAADAGIPIVSMSLGGAGYSQSLEDAITYAWQRNTLVIAAAGNSSTNALTFPAGANYTLGISATTSTGALASFSNYGTFVDLAAPGVSILSTAPSYSGVYLGIQNYAMLSGTSMATPHVAAVAALIAMTTPGAGAAAIAQRLERSASASGGPWNQNTGWGIVNAGTAVAGPLPATGASGVTGQIVDPNYLPVDSATVSISPGGSSIVTASDGLFRLSVAAPGDYTVTAGAAGMPTVSIGVNVIAGADSAVTIALASTTSELTGQVIANGTGAPGAIVRALSNGLAAGTATTDAQGNYYISLPAGTYQLVASGIGAIPTTGPTVGTSSAPVNLQLNMLGTVAGTVLNGSAQPLSGATVAVVGAAAATTVATDSNGHFSTIGLPTGTYTVTSTYTGLPTATASVSVAPNTAAAASLTMGTTGAGSSLIRINAGAGSYTDPANNIWAADNSYSGGGTWSVTNNITNTTTPTLYQTCRWGTFTYQIPVANGSYTVKLKFAEISLNAAGQRVFNVAINGSTVLSNFDIFAQAGGKFIALDKSFPVTVSNGQIAIQFTNGSSNSPMVNAIEIVTGAAPAVGISVGPTGVSLSAGATQQFTAAVTGTTNTAVTWTLSPQLGSISSAGLYTAPSVISTQQTVTVTATSAADTTKTAAVSLTVNPPATTGFTPVRVNAGGAAYTDSNGTTWAADTGYSAGASWSVTNPIANTVSPVLYQTCRYGSAFGYQYNVPNGTYTVTLKFAEVTYNGAGKRQFNVTINGAPVLTNFDIFATAGGELTAVDKSFPVTVTGGVINVQFSTGAADWPMVNGIDIESAGAIAPPPAFASIRVNSGGPAFTDNTGNPWTPDQNFAGGSTWAVSNAIANTLNPTLYQTCRYGQAFSYNFTVPNGTYKVVLKFAEVSRSAPAQRQFNVAIGGSPVLTNFDIFAAAGGEFLAIDKTFPITVTNGQIAIQFTAGTADWPMINAIEIDAQ